MASYNKVILIGNLTRDPEMRYLPKGTAVCQLSLAVNRVWKDDSGTEHEEVTFVEIEIMGKQAEASGKYLSKGRPVFVEGRLKLDTWDDKETGKKRYKLRVVGERIQFLGAPKNVEFSGDASAERPPARRDTAPAPTAPVASEGEASSGGDDIPF